MAALRSAMEKKGFTAMIVSEEDEVAWLFNLRGEGETTHKVQRLTIFASTELTKIDRRLCRACSTHHSSSPLQP